MPVANPFDHGEYLELLKLSECIRQTVANAPPQLHAVVAAAIDANDKLVEASRVYAESIAPLTVEQKREAAALVGRVRERQHQFVAQSRKRMAGRRGGRGKGR